jgi:hypothetical protein
VSHRKIISLFLRVKAAILLNVFLVGLETLSEQTFWQQKFSFGNFKVLGIMTKHEVQESNLI